MTTNDSPNDLIQDLTEMMLDVQKHAETQARKQDRMEGRLDRIETRLDRLETNLQCVLAEQHDLGKKADRVFDLLDGIASRITDDDVERAALTAQVNRHEDWIVGAAPLVRVDYTPGS